MALIEIDKKRIYYIVLPLLAALWPVWLATVSLPKARSAWEDETKLFIASRASIEQILNLDPDRLEALSDDRSVEKFTYPVAINRIATMVNIPPASYRVNTLPPVRPASGQATQNAMIMLDRVGIHTLSRFVSLAELRYYPSLKCTQLSLSKYRDEKNIWRAEMTFTYYE